MPSAEKSTACAATDTAGGSAPSGSTSYYATEDVSTNNATQSHEKRPHSAEVSSAAANTHDEPQASGVPKAEPPSADRITYGILGIRKGGKMGVKDPLLDSQSLGIDLTTLGLNLNTPNCLYATFASPWGPQVTSGLDFNLPSCYNLLTTLPWDPPLQKLRAETLFYIFYNMTRDLLQSLAARELHARNWKYHKTYRKWLMLLTEADAGAKRWQYFEPSLWTHRFYTGDIDPYEFLSEEEMQKIQESVVEQARQHQQVFSAARRPLATQPLNATVSTAPTNFPPASMMVNTSVSATSPSASTLTPHSSAAANAAVRTQVLRNHAQSLGSSIAATRSAGSEEVGKGFDEA